MRYGDHRRYGRPTAHLCKGLLVYSLVKSYKQIQDRFCIPNHFFTRLPQKEVVLFAYKRKPP